MVKKSFEDALTSLEALTAEMESGELRLEESLKKFEEGIKLVEFCNRKLDEAQKKVDILLNRDGDLVARPFTEEADPDL